MPLNRRTMLKTGGFVGAATAIAGSPGFAASCQVGPAPHDKGPKVWMDMDQIELDSAYDQSEYAPMIAQILKRYASRSAEVRVRLGEPKRFSYGPTSIEDRTSSCSQFHRGRCRLDARARRRGGGLSVCGLMRCKSFTFSTAPCSAFDILTNDMRR